MRPILEGPSRVPSRCLGQNRAATRVSKSKRRHLHGRYTTGSPTRGRGNARRWRGRGSLRLVCAAGSGSRPYLVLFLRVAQDIRSPRGTNRDSHAGEPRDRARKTRVSECTGATSRTGGGGDGAGNGDGGRGTRDLALRNHVRLVSSAFAHPSLPCGWPQISPLHEILSYAGMCASQTLGSGVILGGATQGT